MKKKIGKFAVLFIISGLAMFGINAAAQVTRVSPSEQNGIFEHSEDIKYKIEYNSASEADLSVTLTDYFGSAYLNRTVACGGEISLGSIDTGWYRINIAQSGKLVYSGTLSVVPDHVDMGDTPFAADMAANFVVSDKAGIAGYARAARLSGRSWIRERFRWETNSDGTYNYDTFPETVDAEAAENLNILAVFADPPHTFGSKTEALTSELNGIYDFMYKTADKFKGRVQGWEIWNEPDFDNFAEVPADVYSSFLKAAALGAKDADGGALTLFGGLCQYTDSNMFASLMMKNDAMRYSDAYNIHRHLGVESTATQHFDTDFVDEHRTIQSEARPLAPLWVTEAGLAMPIRSLNDETLKKQARYAVTSCAESLSAGVDKHFWFIIPSYVEANRYQYGAMDGNGLTNPAYASMAVMASMLGKAEYKGRLNNTNVSGYVFSDGEKDILVVWSDTNRTLLLPGDGNVKAYNLMGRETSITSIGSLIMANSGSEPMYIVFENGMSASSYTAAEHPEPDTTEPFGVNEHIVIQADFNEERLDTARDFGYVIEKDETRTVDVKVYNFNDTAVSGMLVCEAEGFDIDGSGVMAELGAGESKTFTVTVTPNEAALNKTGYISFALKTESGQSSPTVAAAVVYDDTGNNLIHSSDVANGGVYPNPETAVFTLPYETLNVKVRLDGNTVEPSISGTEVSVDLSGIAEGSHTLVLCAGFNDETVYRKTVHFTVRENDIYIEGEDLTDQSEGFAAMSYSGTSGGRCGRLMSATDTQIVIDFYAPKSGLYKLKFKASKHDDVLSASPYEVSCNGEEIGIKQTAAQGTLAQYSASVLLNAGRNNVTFTAIKPRTLDSRYFMYLDYISLAKQKDSELTVYGGEYESFNEQTEISEDSGSLRFFNENTVPEFTYSLTAPMEGMYSLSAQCSMIGVNYTSDFVMSVNGKDYRFDTNNAVVLSGKGANASVEYTAYSVHLKKGVNNITIRAVEGDKSNVHGGYIIYVDSFTFKYLENDIITIEGEAVSEFTKNGEAVPESEADYAVLTNITDGSASGGAVLRVKPVSGARPLKMTYNFNVDYSGEYIISLDRGVCDNSYLATGIIEIGGKRIEMKDANVKRISSGALIRLAEGNVPLNRYRMNDTVYLKAGENTLSIVLENCPQGRDDDLAWFVLDKIGLEKVINAEDFSLGLSKDNIKEGETADIVIYDADGAPVPAWKLNNISFGSADGGIASADENAVVTGMGEGICDISASFTYNGRTYVKSAEVKVKNNEYGIIIDSVNTDDSGVEVVYTTVKELGNEPITIIGAGYDGGLDLNISEASLPPANLYAKGYASISGDEISLFIWRSIESMQPVVGKITID